MHLIVIFTKELDYSWISRTLSLIAEAEQAMTIERARSKKLEVRTDVLQSLRLTRYGMTMPDLCVHIRLKAWQYMKSLPRRDSLGNIIYDHSIFQRCVEQPKAVQEHAARIEILVALFESALRCDVDQANLRPSLHAPQIKQGIGSPRSMSRKTHQANKILWSRSGS